MRSSAPQVWNDRSADRARRSVFTIGPKLPDAYGKTSSMPTAPGTRGDVDGIQGVLDT